MYICDKYGYMALLDWILIYFIQYDSVLQDIDKDLPVAITHFYEIRINGSAGL